MTEKRILIGEFYQESNAFNPLVTDMNIFKDSRVMEGQAFYDECIKLESGSFKGLCDAIHEEGGEVIPAVSVFQQGAGGRVADEVMDYTKQKMRYYIEKHSGGFDAIFLSLHGATCTESEDDACGALVEYIRSLVGNEIIIAASFDLHANVTEILLKNLDVICGYQTYPHVDIYEAGYRAGKIGMKKLAGEKIYQAAVRIPVIVPPSGYSNKTEPFKSVYDYGQKLVHDGVLMDYSVFNVQPWLDISCLASTVVTIADTEEAAIGEAEKLAEIFYAGRDGYWPELRTIDDVLDIAENNDSGKVVVMADAADSANGGAAGDTMEPIVRMLQRGSTLKAAMNVRDAETVERAYQVGEGNTAEFEIGNKLTSNVGGPLKCKALVRKLTDGTFIAEADQDKGAVVNIGKTAVLEIGNVSLVVCSGVAASTGDPQMFRGFGIEPTDLDVVVVKANTSFQQPYGKFTDLMYYIDAPGACASNLNSFKWYNIPEGMYPFNLPESYDLRKAKLYR